MADNSPTSPAVLLGWTRSAGLVDDLYEIIAAGYPDKDGFNRLAEYDDVPVLIELLEGLWNEPLAWQWATVLRRTHKSLKQRPKRLAGLAWPRMSRDLLSPLLAEQNDLWSLFLKDRIAMRTRRRPWFRAVSANLGRNLYRGLAQGRVYARPIGVKRPESA